MTQPEQQMPDSREEMIESMASAIWIAAGYSRTKEDWELSAADNLLGVQQARVQAEAAYEVVKESSNRDLSIMAFAILELEESMGKLAGAMKPYVSEELITSLAVYE